MGVSNDLAPTCGRPGSLILHRLKRMFAGDETPQPGWSATSPPLDAEPRPDRPIVLVVDDNPVNLMLASEMLSFWRIQPLLAADGAEAVALACELRLDLILMDLQMPVLDGLAATAQIRRFEREHSHARVPIVAYTSCGVNADHPQLRGGGMDAVLEKPGDAQAFRECVMRWCFPADDSAVLSHNGKHHPHPAGAITLPVDRSR